MAQLPKCSMGYRQSLVPCLLRRGMVRHSSARCAGRLVILKIAGPQPDSESIARFRSGDLFQAEKAARLIQTDAVFAVSDRETERVS